MKTRGGWMNLALPLVLGGVGCAVETEPRATGEATHTEPIAPESLVDEGEIDAQQTGCVVSLECVVDGTYACSMPDGSQRQAGRLYGSAKHEALFGTCLPYGWWSQKLKKDAARTAVAGVNAWLDRHKGGSCATYLNPDPKKPGQYCRGLQRQ